MFCLFVFFRFRNFKEHLYKILSRWKLQQSESPPWSVWVKLIQIRRTNPLGIDLMPLSVFSLRYTTVEKLQQSYLFIPNKYKVRNFFVSMWTWIITVLKFLQHHQNGGVSWNPFTYVHEYCTLLYKHQWNINKLSPKVMISSGMKMLHSHVKWSPLLWFNST